MPGQLYRVRPSEGKGEGIFALKNIRSGTAILHDKATMRLQGPRTTGGKFTDITHQDVQHALTQLPDKDQKKFLQLHEGNRTLPKLLRIYKANAFGDPQTGYRLYLDIAKVNHSCVPNAEIADDDEGSVDGSVVMAIQDIKKGEEIFICYLQQMKHLTKAQRGKIFKVYYGFECVCSACSLDPKDLMLSDARRQLLNVLMFKLRGLSPPSWQFLERLSEGNAESPEMIMGTQAHELHKPLTDQEKTVFSFFCARLQEVEGFSGSALAEAYDKARSGIGRQVIALDPILVLDSVVLYRTWQKKAVDVIKTARGLNHKEIKQHLEVEAADNQNTRIRLTHQLMADNMDYFRKQGIDRADVYAVQVEGMTARDEVLIHPLTKKACIGAARKARNGQKLEYPGKGFKIRVKN